MKLFKRRAKPAPPAAGAPSLDSPGQVEYWRDQAWAAWDKVRALTSEQTVLRQRLELSAQSFDQISTEARRLGGLLGEVQRELAALRAAPLSAKQLKFDRSCRVCLELMPWGTQHVCSGMAVRHGVALAYDLDKEAGR